MPRLVLASRSHAPVVPPRPLFAVDVEEFARLVLRDEMASAVAYADRARAAGVSQESLYLELLAPAARHLGDLWTEDLLGFAEVTLGLGQLHRVLRELSPAFESGPIQPRQDRRALLVRRRPASSIPSASPW